MLYFHTAPTDDGNHTIRAGAFTPRVQKVYFVFESVEMSGREALFSVNLGRAWREVGRPDCLPGEMSRFEAQLALVGHLANNADGCYFAGMGEMNKLALTFSLREHGVWLRTRREPDYSADAVLKFVSDWVALHQEPVAP